MNILDQSQLSDEICGFINSNQNPILFAGAGVGVRAGLPDWGRFMEHLAVVADDHEPLIAELIRKRASRGSFISAGTAYKICEEIPIGIRYTRMAEPFILNDMHNALHALVSLPFSAIVTTNYDRSLLESYSSVFKRAPLPIELDDGTLKGAPFIRGFYIARIHGRVELPQSLIVDESDYNRIDDDPVYVDFVKHILTRYSCMFIGFSFLDPAIRRVFRILEERLSPKFPESHLALLSSSSSGPLQSALSRFNIQSIFYDNDDGHQTLWEAIADSSRTFSDEEKQTVKTAVFALETQQRFLGACYARSSLAPRIAPLQKVIFEGIVLRLILDSGESGITVKELTSELQSLLGLSINEAMSLKDSALENLSGKDLFWTSGDRLQATQDQPDLLHTDIATLSQGAIHRLRIREGVHNADHYAKIIEECIEEVLMTRSWDLGAHYAGSLSVDDPPSTLSTIYASVDLVADDLGSDLRRAIVFAIHDLLQRPDEGESVILARLGRIAFGLQLSLIAPVASIAYQSVLPEVLYLDSNVLMPAILNGHPFNPVYVDALKRLIEATGQVGNSVTVRVAEVFLNEIVSHRALAINEVEILGLEDPNELKQYIAFHGAENVNVFISSYSSFVGREGRRLKFTEFLHQNAPYNDENQLKEYLSKQGVDVVRLSFDEDSLPFLNRVNTALINAYEDDPSARYDRKPKILIKHEARQLARLISDLQIRKIRALFVTADSRLRRLSIDLKLEAVGRALISHRNLVQMVDLLLGLETDSRALSRILWATWVDDDAARIHRYFVDLGLAMYDEAQILALPEVLSRLEPHVMEVLEAEEVPIFPAVSLDSQARIARFLDRFEREFYVHMDEAVQKYRQQLED